MFKFAFALAAMAAAVPALAQDVPDAFNGPFIGVQGGWQQDRQTLELDNRGLISSARQNKSGLGYGGQIGYDFRLSPQVVLGAEVALTGRTGSSRLDGSGLELEQGRTVSATGRLGFLTSPTSLVYARGGYANARFNLRGNGADISENREGWQVGVGAEQQLSRNVSARVEYAYSRFGNDRLPTLASNLGADDARLKYSRNGVTAGLNFRF